jgi:hypothetical protein
VHLLLRRAALTALAAVALLPVAGAQAATPGVNIANVNNPDEVNAAIATGAKQIRAFAVWADFEPGSAADYSTAAQNGTGQAWDAALTTMKNAGVTPVIVIAGMPSWAGGPNGPDPGAYASFVGEFAAHNAAAVGVHPVYEVWNEPDETQFWPGAPDPAAYTNLLRPAYAAIKAADAAATVLTGPMTGNHYQWLQALYNNGAGGSFDGVAVHTDTACLDRGPDSFYRDEAGNLARFTFLGYRTVKAVMDANGDGGKGIWMTELGWSSTGGRANTCTRGTFAHQKPDGVSVDNQAKHLAHAYECLANDGYVVSGLWFTLRDNPGQSIDELRHYGLEGKPSLNAFKAVTAANGGSAGACGDFEGPSIKILSPANGQQFVDKLDIQASARDGAGQGAEPAGLGRVTFMYDNAAKIRNFTGRDIAEDRLVALAPWQGSGGLGLGAHTITVSAVDMNGNVSNATVTVTKVKTLRSTLTPRFSLAKKALSCKRASCSFKGSLTGRGPSLGGKVRVEWLWKNKQGKFRKLVGGLKPANKAFTFKARLRKTGSWKVRVVYVGQAPYKKAASKSFAFRVK